MQQHYSIGAVAKLTNIPAHTLRKWESRHGIATPLRSATGRRVYTDNHVETLKLIKRLMRDGHSLAHLAGLPDATLRDLAAQHVEPERPTLTSLTLVGPNLARLLPGQRIVTHRFGGSLPKWLAQQPADLTTEPVSVECETLPGPTVEQLIALRGRVAHLLVVYTFASRRTLSALQRADIKTVRGPVDDNALLLNIAPFAPGAVGAAGAETNIAADTNQLQRFSMEELARIAALNPALQCECPNHIAKLLMDISSFEKYSLECVDTDPAAQELHARLGAISAQARALFEDALLAVASADGIQLQVSE